MVLVVAECLLAVWSKTVRQGEPTGNGVGLWNHSRKGRDCIIITLKNIRLLIYSLFESIPIPLVSFFITPKTIFVYNFLSVVYIWKFQCLICLLTSLDYHVWEILIQGKLEFPPKVFSLINKVHFNICLFVYLFEIGSHYGTPGGLELTTENTLAFEFRDLPAPASCWAHVLQVQVSSTTNVFPSVFYQFTNLSTFLPVEHQ